MGESIVARLFARLGVAAAILSLLSAPTYAADNYDVIDAHGTTKTMAAKDQGGVLHGKHLLEGSVAGVPTPINSTISGQLDVNCITGCSGGGGGGGVVTNAGTFAVQQTNAIPAGANTIGTVNLGTLGTAATAANQTAARGTFGAITADRTVLYDNAGNPIDFSASSPVYSVDTRPASSTITVVDSGTTSAAGQSGVNLVSGTPTANSFQMQAVNAQSSVSITTTGTFVGTLAIEGSGDGGTTYAPVSGLLRGTSLTTASITGPSVVSADLTGFTNVRVRATSYTSGTATVKMTTSPAPGLTKILNPILPGTNNIGSVGLSAPTTGGCTVGGAPSAASTNATSIKASAGTLCGGVAINTTATVYYLRLYDLAAAPTCSSATGFLTTIPVPSSTSGAGTVINFGSYGANFPTGIAYCLTGGGASNDNTNAATGVFLSYSYK